MRLTTSGDRFLLDGEPFRLLAGALHYFRVMPDRWRDRLLKLKACGLNTVETYVPWNLHEPRPGEFNFSGLLDIEAFLEQAAELELLAIVRPGPYICSEWDFGGLPPWLLADPAMRVRCAYPPYLAAVDRYLDALLARLQPLLASQGGPIVALQVENEYGSYGNDKRYLQHLADGYRARGAEELLFTSDGPGDWMLEGGTLPEVLKVVNFGSNPDRAFEALRRWQPTGPLMCGEFWNGWFDHFGEPHHARDAADVASVLDRMLELGAAVNFYMFHGGTNFGFMAGANTSGTTYQPDVSSYDYDALLDEAGDPTPKYWACREVIGRYVPLPEIALPEPAPKAAYGRVELHQRAALLDNLNALSKPVDRAAPEPMEMLGQNWGLVLYRTEVHGPREEQPVVLQEVHDRALVFLDGVCLGVVDRNGDEPPITLALAPGPHRLEVLVEAMGRVNYGPQLHDRKGITEGIRLGQQFLFGWSIFPLPLDDLTRLDWQPASGAAGPVFCRGRFTVNEAHDTWLSLGGWRKGVAYVNGFNLGRYWDRGPQRSLYVPGSLLHPGENELVILELHQPAAAVELCDGPDLG
ncbi:MAG: beta-galactosidase [Armatimonadetes bacterium]|nr:beta-galactosidase [Armatimonadota bacterium]